MNSQAPLRPSSERKRAALLDAAEEAFLRDGYAQAAMDEITRAARVSKQTAYAHFASKEGLFVAVVERANGSAFQAAHLDDPDPIDAEALAGWLRRFARAQLEAVLEPRVLALRRLVIAEAERHPDLAAAFWAAGPEASIGRLAERIAGFDESGLLRAPDPRMAAEHLNWIVMGEAVTAAMMRGAEGVPGAAERDRIADAGVQAFLRGYAG
jgi:TetR/AcrR family transcriptional regulator, mexJK operon transcriptional repressor